MGERSWCRNWLVKRFGHLRPKVTDAKGVAEDIIGYDFNFLGTYATIWWLMSTVNDCLLIGYGRSDITTFMISIQRSMADSGSAAMGIILWLVPLVGGTTLLVVMKNHSLIDWSALRAKLRCQRLSTGSF